MEIDRNNYSSKGSIATALTAADGGCVADPDPHILAQYPKYWSHHATFTAKPNDAGTIVQSRMSGLLTAPNTISTFGFVFYEKSPTNDLVYCNTIFDKNTAVSRTYNQLYLLPGSSNQYVGSMVNRTSGNEVMYMYQYTDKGANSEILDGIKLPYSTDIRTASMTDGFFVLGNDGSGTTNAPAIAKLSTCVDFKLDNEVLPDDRFIHVEHAPNLSINLPLTYVGAKAPVQNGVFYDLLVAVESGTVNGITSVINGGELEKIENQVVESFAAGTGTVLNLNRTYTVGEDPVIIKFHLTIRDTYTTAEMPQSCGQTYSFYLKSVPQTDVVAMPSLNETTNKIDTSIKNIGLSNFSKPYNITIYKDFECTSHNSHFFWLQN